MRATSRLQCLDRVEELRVALSSGAQNKYIKDLMDHYSKGTRSEKAIQKSKPKSVATGQAFDALKRML
jgi:hypothetical protein